MYAILSYIFLVALTALFAITTWNTRVCSYWRSRNITFIKPVSVLSKKILNSIFVTQSRLAAMYHRAGNENFIGFYQLRNPVLMICSPHLVDIILRKEFDSFSATRSEQTVSETKDPLSQNLLSLSLRKWKNVRKEMSRLFAPHNMKCYLKYLNQHADRFIDELKNDQNTNSFVGVNEYCHLFSVRTILSCIMGENLTDLDDPTKIHPALGKKSLQYGYWPLFWWNLKLTYPKLFKLLRRSGYSDEVKDFFVNYVKQLIEKDMKSDSGAKTGFLTQLITNEDLEKDSVSRDAFINIVCAQVYTLFVGGTDSITTTLSCALYELARRPDVLKKVRKEVVTVAATYGSFTYSALSSLNYLECVIKETMRLHPPGYSISRKCTKTIFIPEFNIQIEKGMDVVIPVLELHKDPRYFENPTEFNPLRFTESNSLNILPGSYLPFGDGPRRCVGVPLSLLEIKMALAKLCTEFETMELCENQRDTFETEELSRVYMLKNDLYVKFVKSK